MLFLIAALLFAGVAATAGPAHSRATAASLRITPGNHYVGGQALVWAGNIGATGERRVHLELNAWYSGNVWGEVEGFSARTKPNGDFSFVFPAPAMRGIRYRVASGRLATPFVTFDAHSQDLSVTPVGVPKAGVPFDLVVDTTPTLSRRPDTIGLQPIPGRQLTLQKRVTPTRWKEIDTTEVGPLGLGRFTVREPAGGHVYRVVQENWSVGGNRIGWFPSFPTYVDVRGASSSSGDTVPVPTTRPVIERVPATTSSRVTASSTHQWGVSLFDFAWLRGESLSSKPHRGSNPKGSWTEYNDGGGRIASHNGGLFFDSKRDNKPGPGDFGTTMATMKGNPMRYGRWEVRVRARSEEKADQDYLVRVELVPAEAKHYDCGAHNITVGEMKAHGNSISVGVNAGDRRWRYRKTVGGVNNVHYALAAEVARRHITWFVNGRPVATVKNAKAVSDLPMTLRLSLVGKGRQEMNDTDILSDWQRGFSLVRGKQVTSGDAMQVGSYKRAC